MERYAKVGGVRIEDDCVIHADRIEVISHLVPKEIAEIEAIMAWIIVVRRKGRGVPMWGFMGWKIYY